MMIRVESYPHDAAPPPADGVGGASPPSPPPHTCPTSVLYASLSTSSHHAERSDGTIVTVGRKNCDATFGSDKSVSRSHCSFRLIRRFDGEEDEEERREGGIAEYGKPATDEERAACDNTEGGGGGPVLVVEDMGSKFGTYLVLPVDEDDDNKTKKQKSDNGGSETDETDDEGGVGTMSSSVVAGNGPDLSLATRSILRSELEGGKKYRLHKIPPKTSHPLLRCFDDDDDDRPILVQIGQSGTTICLTPATLRCCLSRIPVPVKTRLKSLPLEPSGVTISTSWIVGQTTHLVSPDRIATGKCIAAWAARVPIVSASFVEAVAKRSRPSDPFPDVEEHRPPGTLPMDDDEEEEDDGGKDRDRRSMGGYLTVSLAEGDMEWVMACAGSDIFKSYELSDEEYFKSDWLADLSAKATEEGKILVFVDTSSKKVKKRKDYLLKKHRGEVVCVGQKEVASAITKRRHLVDGDGNELVPTWKKKEDTTTATATTKAKTKAGKGAGEPVARSGNDSTREAAGGKGKGHDDDEAGPGPNEAPSRGGKSPAKEASTKSNETVDVDAAVPASPTRRSSPRKRAAASGDDDVPSSPTRRSPRKRAGGVDDAPASPSRRSSPRKRAAASSQPKKPLEKDGGNGSKVKGTRMEVVIEEDEEEEAAVVVPAAPQKYAKGKTTPEAEADRPKTKRKRDRDGVQDVDVVAPSDKSNEEPRSHKRRKNEAKSAVPSTSTPAPPPPPPTPPSPPPPSSSSGKRQSLPQTNDGWLLAAPPARDAYRKKKSDYLRPGGGHGPGEEPPPDESAGTEGRSDLVVRTEAEVRDRRNRTSNDRRGRRRVGGDRNRSGVPDYKRFKKNSILYGSDAVGAGGGTFGSTFSRIRLRAVLPRESERMRQMELTQQELEREQRVADALFNEPAGVGGVGGGGGIRSFFGGSQSTRGGGRGKGATGRKRGRK